MNTSAAGIAPSTQHPARAAPLRSARLAVENDRGQDQDEQHLAQLGRLELEERQLDPALGAACGGAQHQDEHDRAEDGRVEADLELAEARVVDPRDREHQRDSRRPRRSTGGSRSSADSPGTSCGGRLAERVDRKCDQADRPREQGEVQPQHPRALEHALARLGEGPRPGLYARPWSAYYRHYSNTTVPASPGDSAAARSN